MSTLSPVQLGVLQKMAAGWELRYREVGKRMAYLYRLDPIQFETVRLSTFSKLEDFRLVRMGDFLGQSMTRGCSLTKKGRAAATKEV